jgi:hypothetical protein
MVLRVLGLHGSEQNSEVLRTRLGRIVPKVKLLAKFTYLDASHILPLRLGNDVRYHIILVIVKIAIHSLRRI